MNFSGDIDHLHQAVKYDFTADLTGTGNRSEEVLKSQSFFIKLDI